MISPLAATAVLFLELVSLHKLRSWLPLPACVPNSSPFMISLLATAAAVFPKLVSVPDFALGCRCRLVIFLPAFDADAIIR